MARVTVEDCLKNIANRFELTLAATQRARQIAGSPASLMEQAYVTRENKEKATVIALREIESGKVGIEILNKTPN